MKIFLLACALTAGAILPSKATASSHKKEAFRRFYLAPGSLFMDGQGLFVSIAGELYPVTAVHSDERGVYIDEWEYKWTCAECKKPNPIWFSFCAWCGKPKPKPEE